MGSVDEVQTLVFMGLTLLAALVLVKLRPGRPVQPAPDWLIVGVALPVATLVFFFWQGEANGYADALRIEVNRFAIPFTTLDHSGSTRRFVVGDQIAGSDLLVSPYGDPARSREVQGPDSRPLVELHASRDGETVRAWLCLYNYPTDERFDLPGWQVTAAPGLSAGEARTQAKSCSVQIADTPVRVEIGRTEPGSSGVARRRAFIVSRTASAIAIRLTAPLSANLGHCGDNSLRLMPTLGPADDLGYLPEADLRFPVLGSGGEHPLLDPAHLGDAMPARAACAEREPEYRWPWTGPARVMGVVKRLFLPWFLVVLAAVNALVLYALRARDWRENRLEAMIVLALQWMLMLRILVGVAGIYNDATQSRSEVLLDVATAYLALPMVAIALLLRGGAEKRGVLIALALYLLVAMGATILWVGSLDGAMVPLAILALALLALGLRYAFPGGTALLQGWSARLAGERGADIAWRWGIGLLAAASLARVAMAVLGWVMGAVGIDMPLTEHIGPFQIALFYQPLMILGFTWLLIGLMRRPGFGRALVVALLFGWCFVGINVFVHDFGLLMIYGWPVAMVMAWVAVRQILPRKGWAATAVVAAPVLVPLLFFALAGYYSRIELPDPQSAPAAQLLATTIAWNDGNSMRLIRYARPSRVEQFGNKQAYGTLDQAASLEPLARNLVGQGYLKPSYVHRPLLSYQYSDNLSAVHIMWPFGRFGMMGLLIFLFVLAEALHAPIEAGERSAAADTLSIASRMAALTLFWAGLYMAMANLNIVPFTGRNVYLLAATSGSDLLEGLAMILLAAAPWAVRRAA